MPSSRSSSSAKGRGRAREKARGTSKHSKHSKLSKRSGGEEPGLEGESNLAIPMAALAKFAAKMDTPSRNAIIETKNATTVA